MIDWNNSTTSISITNKMSRVNRGLNTTMERLASGYRLNHASDGAADLTISENLTSQIRGYGAASNNVQQGLSMLQTADGAMQQISDHLQNIREIAVKASNGTTTSAQFTTYESQLTEEIAAITAIASNTRYGSNVLLDGSISGGSSFNLQIGSESGDTLDIKSAFTDNTATGLSVTQTTLASASDATTLMGQIDSAITTLGGNLAKVGGYETRLTDHMDYLNTAITNSTAARSSIRDTDVASEAANLARYQVLQQAGAFVLSQANQTPNMMLRLLQ